MLFIIKFYQRHLYFLFPGQCRYDPSCSIYTYQAIKKYGTIVGLRKGIARILSCYG